MSVPGQSGNGKLGNPAWIKVNHQFSTELRMLKSNRQHEAGGKEVVSRNASEGIEPRNVPCSTKATGFISPKPEMPCAIG
jgi:hypothetical protein